MHGIVGKIFYNGWWHDTKFRDCCSDVLLFLYAVQDDSKPKAIHLSSSKYIYLIFKAFHPSVLAKTFACIMLVSLSLHSLYTSPLPPQYLNTPCIPSMVLCHLFQYFLQLVTVVWWHMPIPLPVSPSNHRHKTTSSGLTAANNLLHILLCNIFLKVLSSRCSQGVFSYYSILSI